MTGTKKTDVPTVEEATRVIKHLLSYEDNCEETLDAVRYIMQWLCMSRPTEAALCTHASILRKPIPEGIRVGVDHVPTTRHRTTMIVEGVLKGYLAWLQKTHPETGDDVDPDAEPIIHNSHHVLVHEHLGGIPERMHTCGYCGKVDAALIDPCPEAKRMNREEDSYRYARLAKFEEALKDFPSLERSLGPETHLINRVEAWYRKHAWPLLKEKSHG